MLSFSSNKYHQSSISCYLDINPYLSFDLNKYESMLLCKDSLSLLTLIPFLQKLNIIISNINKNNITNIADSVFCSHRKYCPKCLEENSYYKLIWQINSIHFCELHNIKLVSECWSCGKKILLLPRRGKMNICPFCNSILSKATITNYLPSNSEISSHNDWSYLLQPSGNVFHSSNILGNDDLLAMKIMYLTKNIGLYKLRMSSLLQLSRSLKETKKVLYVNSIINILRKTNTTFKHFLEMDLPAEFIKEIRL